MLGFATHKSALPFDRILFLCILSRYLPSGTEERKVKENFAHERWEYIMNITLKNVYVLYGLAMQLTHVWYMLSVLLKHKSEK